MLELIMHHSLWKLSTPCFDVEDYMMHARVLLAYFLTNVLVILVKTQTTGVCPNTACSVNDAPCFADTQCPSGSKCCAIGGFECCKAPLIPSGCSCTISDAPCASNATCGSGASCCLDTSLSARCCRPLPTATTVSTTTAVIQCLASDIPCRDDAACRPLNKTCTLDKINNVECCR